MKNKPGAYVAFNALGILLYTYFDWRVVHQIRMEGRDGWDMSDIITHAITAFPVLLLFAVSNLSLGIWALFRFAKWRESRWLVVAGSMLALWVLWVALLRQTQLL